MEPAPRHSSFRFSLRSLLWLTLVTAILAAIAAPFLRELTADQWWRLATTLAVAAMGDFWFAPWSKIRVIKWVPASGKLTLSLRWNSCSFDIAPEDCVQVEELLNEYAGQMVPS